MARRKWIWLIVLVVPLLGGAAAYHRYTTRPVYLLARGRTALSGGNLTDAWRSADALERRGYSNHARLLRSETWLAIGRAGAADAPAALRSALSEASRIRDDGPLAADGAVVAGECLVRLQQPRAAADVLDVVVRRQPDCRAAHRWLSAIYIDLNSPTQAIRHLREWGRLDPDNGRPYRWVGLFYKDYTIQLGEAIMAYQEALKRSLDPDDEAAVRRELAETLLDAHADFQGALDVLEKCPESVRETVPVRTLRAEALWGIGLHGEAEALIDGVLRSAGDYPRALRLRAKMYMTADDPARARPLFEKAVALDPFDMGSRQHLIALCDQLHDPAAVAAHRHGLAEARALWNRVTTLYQEAKERPLDGQLRYEIAVLCLKANRKEQATTMLRAALGCDPNHQEARRLLERTESKK